MPDERAVRWKVLEVHNFGGFFGGDTVTLTAASWDDGREETLTIDEKALSNLHDRYMVAPGMVFECLMVADRVDRAELLGAVDAVLLEPALPPPPAAELLVAPQIRAYFCHSCEIWILGAPDGPSPGCRLCAQPL